MVIDKLLALILRDVKKMWDYRHFILQGLKIHPVMGWVCVCGGGVTTFFFVFFYMCAKTLGEDACEWSLYRSPPKLQPTTYGQLILIGWAPNISTVWPITVNEWAGAPPTDLCSHRPFKGPQ